ncbi:acetylneuraminic acid synthetase [haloarchaeon 3A1-DGR]|nr:acetylneuraminic acid synthetase [haloarchaeon 3A1-DGR]
MTLDFLETDRQIPPYLIAEIGVNHFDIAEKEGIGPIEAAKRMVTAAAEAGADAVKFQSYTAEKLASTKAKAYWDTSEESKTSQYELFDAYDDFGKREFAEIANYTTETHDVDFLSTPFDREAVDYLDPFVPAFKVASADITNHPLLKHIAEKGKPILLSTGASTLSEIDEAIHVIDAVDPSLSVILLHCILEYPTAPKNANLGMIGHISDVFPDNRVGYSDHVRPDEGMITLVNAVVNGATVVEKHFTLDKSIEGNDHYHAMDPADVETFRRNMALVETTNGGSRKQPLPAERDARSYARRSLVAVESIETGETIERDAIAIKRPGTGIDPRLLDIVLGRTARRDIDRDSVIEWEDV